MYRLIRVCLTAVVIGFGSYSSGGEFDFRIQSKVFGDGPQPIAENVTLFTAGLVYDYLESPATVTIFDPARGRFILLDPKLRRQTEIAAKEVDEFITLLKNRCSSDPEPFLKFIANPQFDMQQDAATGELVMASPWMTYRVGATQARSVSDLQKYRDFADWYAKLNTRNNPGSIPPFGRLALNAALFDRNEIPTQVRLDLVGPKLVGQQQVTFRSEHIVTWRLLEADVQRTKDTAKQLSTFNKVSPSEFGK